MTRLHRALQSSQRESDRRFRHCQGRLPPVVDLAFVSRVSHYGDGSKRAAAGEGDFGQKPKWLRVAGPSRTGGS
jgi:hypothetical protein